MKGPAVGGPLDGEEVESRVDPLRIPIKKKNKPEPYSYLHDTLGVIDLVDYGLYFWSPDLQMWEWEDKEDTFDVDYFKLDYEKVITEFLNNLTTESLKSLRGSVQRTTDADNDLTCRLSEEEE